MSSSPNQRPVAVPSERRPPARAWTGRTRGGWFGNWFFIQLIRLLGVWPAYVWLVFVAAWFTLAGGGAYRASADFLRRVFDPLPWWRRPVLVYRHFYAFGVTLLDRLAVLMGRTRIECVFDGEEMFRPYLESRRGIILMGAHVGCWEMGGHFLGRFDIPVNFIVIEREAAGIRRLFDDAMEGRRFRMLTADDNPLRSVPILAALRRGEIVALHSDRSFGGADVNAQFLGGTVRLPVGAWRLAAASGAPIFQVFVVREKIGCYRFFTFPPELVTRGQLRSEPSAIEACVQRYAVRLESVVRRYPFQWGNFFPYWNAVSPRPATESPSMQPAHSP